MLKIAAKKGKIEEFIQPKEKKGWKIRIENNHKLINNYEIICSLKLNLVFLIL